MTKAIYASIDSTPWYDNDGTKDMIIPPCPNCEQHALETENLGKVQGTNDYRFRVYCKNCNAEKVMHGICAGQVLQRFGKWPSKNKKTEAKE